jgi:hypothetical protein
LPPAAAEIIKHFVMVDEENANTVTCRGLAVTTVIDSKRDTRYCARKKEE